MKIGTITNRFGGNNANITKGREFGTTVNSGFEMVASSTSAYAKSGRVFLWNLESYNATDIVAPTATNFLALATNVDGLTVNHTNMTIGGDACKVLGNTLVAILEGVDESHNTHMTTYEGTPLTVVALHDIEIELPYMGTYASGGADRLSVHVTADANTGRLEWVAGGGADNVLLYNIKITKIDATRGLVRFICL